MKTKIINITDATEWFEVLYTGKSSQTAVMILPAGESTGARAEAHEKSEQTLFVIEGELIAEIGTKKRFKMKKGDAVTIPAGTKHKFCNRSKRKAVTFNVYSPPEYPPDTKG